LAGLSGSFSESDSSTFEEMDAVDDPCIRDMMRTWKER
jgi:hypothetical protein